MAFTFSEIIERFNVGVKNGSYMEYLYIIYIVYGIEQFYLIFAWIFLIAKDS